MNITLIALLLPLVMIIWTNLITLWKGNDINIKKVVGSILILLLFCTFIGKLLFIKQLLLVSVLLVLLLVVIISSSLILGITLITLLMLSVFGYIYNIIDLRDTAPWIFYILLGITVIKEILYEKLVES